MNKFGAFLNRPFFIASVYAIVSWMWISVSDTLLHQANLSHRVEGIIDLSKGLVFVAVTALLIYSLLRIATRELAHANRAEDARTESEHRFRVLADSAPVLVWMSDVDAKCDYFNKEWLTFTGRSLEHELGIGWAESIHLEDVQRYLDAYRDAFSARRVLTVEYRLRRHDGQYRWVLTNGVPRSTETGAFAGYIGSCVDISDQKEAAVALASANIRLQEQVALGIAELRKGEERYRTIVETANVGIWEIDNNNRVAFVNSKLGDVLGYSENEMLGTSPVVYCDAEWHCAISSLLEQIRSVGPLKDEVKLRRKDGGVLWGIISATGVVEEGHYRGATILITDITWRRQSEEQLQKYATELSSLIENAPYGIARTTAEGRFLLVNPALVQMTGYDSTEELLNTSLLTLYRDSGVRDRILQDLTARRAIQDVELDLVKKDGSPIRVRMCGVQLPSGELQVMLENITHAHILGEQLRQAAKMEAVGQLAGGIAHDFNNLLMVISSQAELLLDTTDRVKVEKRARQILSTTESAGKLTKKLLAFSRKQELANSTFDLNQLLSETGDLLKHLLPKNIDVDTRLSPASCWVSADRVQMEQTVINLVLNARDAMPEGGKLILGASATIIDDNVIGLHDGVPAGEYAVITVADTGSGIPEQNLGRVFEPFFTTKPKERGTGLGLSMAYGIVSQSGGRISVRSTVGAGTTVSVYLPLAERPREDELKSHPCPLGRSNASCPKEGTILVVDDEELVRTGIRRFLERIGLTVLDCGDALEASKIASELKEDLVLLVTDVVMPQMAGTELAQLLTNDRPELPILFISGYAAGEIGHDQFNNAKFLQKPFTLSALTDVVCEGLRTCPRLRQIQS